MFHDDHHKYFHLNFGQHTLFFDYIFGTLRDGRKKYGEEVFGGQGANVHDKAVKGNANSVNDGVRERKKRIGS